MKVRPFFSLLRAYASSCAKTPHDLFLGNSFCALCVVNVDEDCAFAPIAVVLGFFSAQIQPMNKYIHLFTFKGIPVAVNPLFFLLVIILAIGQNTLIESVIVGVVVIIALLTHEFGHALTARHYNIDSSIILTGLGGVTPLKKTPNRKQSFIITLAGPLSGLVLGGVSYGIIWLLLRYLPEVQTTNLVFFLWQMFMINLIWGIFNLLPIYPMDGGKLLSALLARFCSPKVAPKAAIVISMLFCVALLGYFFIQKNVFMILIGLYLLMINFTGAKQAFTSIEARTQERASLEAEKLYEYGLIAAREHRWKDLENFGFLMKNPTTSANALTSSSP